MLRDLNTSKVLELQTDSSAAKGICKRRGIGKIRHLHTPLLWIQGKVASKEIMTKKIDGKTNTADIGTKVLTEKDYDRLMTQLGFEYRDGKPTGALKAQL